MSKWSINGCGYERPFEATKYQGKWSVYDKVSCTFFNIGKGYKFCKQQADILNSACGPLTREQHESILNYD